MKRLLGINIEEMLKGAVRESVEQVFGSDDEKLRQRQTSSSLKNFHVSKKSKNNPNSDTVDEDEAEKDLKTPVKQDDSESDLPEIDLNAIIELVGSIRAGRSLKDKDTLSAFKKYFSRLNGTERTALFAFLTGISKIMRTPETEEPPTPDTPDSEPYSVKMDRVVSKKKTKKASAGSKKNPKSSPGEDSPIVVGESAKKHHIKKLFLDYK